jgi:hypothetical protein
LAKIYKVGSIDVTYSVVSYVSTGELHERLYAPHRVGLGTLPRLATGQQLAGAAALAGVGFTVALFVTDLTVTDRAAQDQAKVGILVASAVAAALGWLLLHVPLGVPGRRSRASIDPSAGGGAAPER